MFFFVWKSIKNCRCCEGPFFQNVPRYAKKIKRKANVSKNAKKVDTVFKTSVVCTRIHANFKKRVLTEPAVFDALSNKRKLLDLILYFGWLILKIRYEMHVLRKNEKDFRFYQKKAYFRRKWSKILAKNRMRKRKKLVFLKERNTGDLPINFSQKSTFLQQCADFLKRKFLKFQ
jgi:hypothetical protein